MRPATRWIVTLVLSGGIIGCGDEPAEPGDSADTTGAIDVPGGADDAVIAASDVGAESADSALVVDVGSGDVGPADVGAPVDAPVVSSGCKSTAECAIYEDGNQCNGTFFCDLSLQPPACRIKPSTVVQCPAVADTPCKKATCDPTDGACKKVAAPDGTPCVDGDPCTVDSACKAGECKPASGASWCDCKTSSDCPAFVDNNKCKGTMYCDKSHFPWLCRVNPKSVVKCASNQDTACQTNSCDAKTGTCGLVDAADKTPCDDGDAKTADDICMAGTCSGSTIVVKCAKTADCADDGDFCNGVPYCDKNTSTCKVNPATVVKCSEAKDKACQKNTCDPSTGACAIKPQHGTACSDGDACTGGDICIGGSCKGATNLCLCKTDKDCIGKDDGNKCNGLPYCELKSGACATNPATVLVCPSATDTTCLKNACVPLAGKCTMTAVEDALQRPCIQAKGDPIPNCRWERKPANAPSVAAPPCDDGDKCTKGDVCSGGSCAGTFVCTCKSSADCAADDDGNKCNGVLFCNLASGKCELTQPLQCPKIDGIPCRANQCQAATGKCLLAPITDGQPCNDGEKCTKNDFCVAGKCAAGVSLCECITTADCANKEDGNACNGTLYCDKSGAAPKCKVNPASQVVCPALSGQTCATNVCDKLSGQCFAQPAVDGKPCADGDKCTTKTACAKGKCVGKALICDDNNPCTTGKCDSATGCVHVPVPCDDQEPCTLDKCVAGTCVFDATPLDGKGCDADKDGCTLNDRCKLGKCVAGARYSCPKKASGCLVDTCLSTGAVAFQCVPLPAADGKACNDGDVCKLGATCQSGVCSKGSHDKLFARRLALDDGVGSKGGKWHGQLADAVEMVDGSVTTGFIAVGARWQGSADKPTALSWAVTAVDAAGRGMWRTHVDMPVADLAAVARGLMRLDDGSVVAVGARRAQNNVGLQGYVVRLSNKGQSIALKQSYGAPGVVDDVFEAVGRQSAAAWWLVGWRKDGDSKHSGLLYRVSDLGKTLGSWSLTGLYEARLTAMYVRLDGGAVVVGQTNAKGARLQGWVVAVDADGKVKWDRKFDHVGAGGQVLAAVARDPSGFVMSGWRREGAARRSLLVKIGSDGSGGWTLASSGDDIGRGVAVLGTSKQVSSYVVAGRSGKTDDIANLWLRFVDAHGNAVLKRDFDLGANEELRAVKPTADGSLLAVGSTIDAAGVRRPVMVRVTAWGQASCVNAGKCAAIGGAQCDDSNACTDDFCTSKGGCQHSNNVNPCDDGDACTEKDRCQSGTCKLHAPANCDDANACTTDSCDAKALTGPNKVNGCQHKPGGSFCTDGDVCTEGDKCIGGACSSTPKVCQDNNFCTLDGCDKVKGCQAVIAPAKVCDDGNPCTKDLCIDGTKKDKASACKYDGGALHNAACDDGQPCSLGDRCASGVCKAGFNKLYIKTEPMFTGKGYRDHDYPTAVAWWPDGSLAVCAKRGRNLLYSYYVSYLDPRGGKTSSLYKLGRTIARAMVVDGPNLAMLIEPEKPTGTVEVRRVTKSGSTLTSRKLTFTGTLRAVRLAATDDGWLTGLVNQLNSETNVLVHHVTRNGAIRSGAALGPGYLGGLVATPHGAAIVGRNGTQPRIVKVTSAGIVAWQRPVPHSIAAVRMDSTAIHVLTRGPTGASLARLHLDGRLIDTGTIPNTFGWVNVRSFAPRPGGHVLLGSVKPKPADKYRRLWLAGVTMQGNVLWQRTWQGPKNDGVGHLPVDLAPVAGSTYGVLSHQHGLNQPQWPWYLRVDAWGHTDCGAAGKCALVEPAQCNDNDVCTDDSCDPKKGCVNTNNQAQCDDGNACTLAGRCKDGSCAAGSSRSWQVTTGTSDQENLARWGVASDGGGLAVGQLRVGKSVKGFAARLDARGSVAWTNTTLDPNPMRPAQVGDNWLVCGTSGSATKGVILSNKGVLLEKLGAGGGLVSGLNCTATLNGDPVLMIRSRVKQGIPTLAKIYVRVAPNKTEWRPFNAPSPLGRDVDMKAGDGGDIAVASMYGDNYSTLWTFAFHTGPGTIKIRWRAQLTAASGKARLRGVTSPRAGAAVGVGVDGAGPYGGHDGWIVRARNGTVLVERHVGAPGDQALSAIARGATGGFVAVGEASTGAATVGWVVGLDDNLRSTWERHIPRGNSSILSDVHVGEGGSLTMIGDTLATATNRDLWVLRADPWGRVKCADIGACASEDVYTCDDGDPCTIDSCDAAKGCVHTGSATACLERPSCPVATGWKDPPPDQREQFDVLYGKAADHDDATTLVDLGDGRLQAAGYTATGSSSTEHAWMVQATPSGETIWARTWGGNKADRFVAIARHPGSGVVTAGWSKSALFGNRGGADGWLTRVDDSGTMLWTRTFGGADEDSLWGVAVGRKGDVAAVGRTRTGSAGSADGWVVRTDASGAPRWGKTLVRAGGKSIDYLFDVTMIAKGKATELLAVGHSKSTGGDKGYSAKGGFDVWLVRFADDGSVLWDRRFGTAKDDFARDLAATPGGGFAVTGSSLGFGFGDAMLWRFDKEGDLSWQRNFGGKSLGDEGHALTRLPLGGFAVAGFTAAKGAGKRDGWIVVTDEQGKVRWDRTIGKSSDERFDAIVPLRHGGFGLAGSRQAPDSQAWLVRTNPWGYADCKKAGRCAHNGPDLCDDGVSCTLDLCDTKTGCTHTVIPGTGTCGPLNTKDKAAVSCLAIKKTNPGAKSGTYWVTGHPDFKQAPMKMACDMDTDGGGWTLLVALSPWSVPGSLGGKSDAPGKHCIDQSRLTDKLANMGRGEVSVPLACVDVNRLAAMSRHAAAWLVETGAGLVKVIPDAKTMKDAHYTQFEPWLVGGKAWVAKSMQLAPGVRMPVSQPQWRAIAPVSLATMNTLRKGCGAGTDCALMPFNALGKHLHLHHYTHSPAAGYDGRVPHYSKLWVR